jgi:uncharacterized protein YqgV (UPF0045/DUF77 family)
VSYIPLSRGVVDLEVMQVLKLIEESGLEFKIGKLSTEIVGKKSKVLSLIGEILEMTGPYVVDVKFSDQCGLQE